MTSLSNFVIGENDCTYHIVMKAFLADQTAKLQVQKDWTKLAYQLEIDLTDINTIRKEVRDGQGMEDIIFTLLSKWAQKENKNATMKKLHEHLVYLNWNHIAANLDTLFPPKNEAPVEVKPVGEAPKEQAKATPSSSSEISTAPQRPKQLQYCFEYFEGYQPKDLFAEAKSLMSSITLQKEGVNAMILQTAPLLKLDTNLTSSLSLSGMTQTEIFMKYCELVENSWTEDAKEKTLNLWINLLGLDGFCDGLRKKLKNKFGHIAKIEKKLV